MLVGTSWWWWSRWFRGWLQGWFEYIRGAVGGGDCISVGGGLGMSVVGGSGSNRGSTVISGGGGACAGSGEAG